MISLQHPTENDAVIDSVRPLLLAKDLGAKSFGEYRTHMRRSGHSIDHWPEFALTSHDDCHVTKAGFAILLLTEFDKARMDSLKRTSVMLPPLPPHPERTYMWTEAEKSAIQKYADQATRQAETMFKVSLDYWRSMAQNLLSKLPIQKQTNDSTSS